MANITYLTRFNSIRFNKALRTKKTFKNLVSLDLFRKKYIKFYYKNREIERLRKILNIGKGLVRMALTKRKLLNRFVNLKYSAMTKKRRTFTRMYYYAKRKRKRFWFKEGKRFIKKHKHTKLHVWKCDRRKKKLNYRFALFKIMSYDNFLFYLTTLNNKLIIKPFNFFHSLFFYKSRTFKMKCYYLRKRKKRRKRYFYRKIFGRRNFFKRRRLKRLTYKLKKVYFKKRFYKMKIRAFKSFSRFITFFHICKKINLNKNDIFKIKSISYLPYKLLKFKYNKLTNSYNFLFNLKKQKIKKNQIIFTSIQNKLEFEKNKLYKNIKRSLLNKINYKYKVNLSIFNKEQFSKIEYYSIFYFLIQKLLFEYNLKYIIYKNLNLISNKYNYFIKMNLLNCTDYINHKLKIKHFKNMIKLIFKTSKRLVFFEKTLNNVKKKKTKNLSSFFLKKVLKFFLKKKEDKKKTINLFKNKYKQVIENLVFIVNYFQTKLEKLILNFYILFLDYRKKFKNFVLLTKKKKFIKKVKFFLKKKKNKRFFFSYLFSKKKFLFYKPKKLPLSLYTLKKINRPWARHKAKQRKNRRLKRGLLKEIYKTYSYKNFNLYTFSLKKLKQFSSYFYGKKLKYIQFNHLRKINNNFSKIKQTNKNLNFLNVK